MSAAVGHVSPAILEQQLIEARYRLTKLQRKNDAIRAELAEMREALQAVVASCVVAPIYSGKNGGKRQDDGYAAMDKARALLARGKV